MPFEALQTTSLVCLAIIVGTYLLLTRILGTMQDPREPPSVSGVIPYIGHVIGLMRSKFNYYVQLRYLTSLAMSTINIRYPLCLLST